MSIDTELTQDHQTCRAARNRCSHLSPSEKMGHEIYQLWLKRKAPAGREKSLKAIQQSLDAMLNNEWPGQGLNTQPVGSSVTGLGCQSSDADLVIRDPARPNGRFSPREEVSPLPGAGMWIGHYDEQISQLLPEWYNEEMVAGVLRRSRFVAKAEHVPSKLAPVVRLTMDPSVCGPDAPTSIDVSVNNVFPIHNSSMIKAYVSLQADYIPALFFGVRYWLSNRGLNDSSGRKTGSRTLSTYAIVLFVIQFLQERRELPCLQQYDLLNCLPDYLREHCQDGREPFRPTFKYPVLQPYHQATQTNSLGKYDVTWADVDGRHALHLETFEADAHRTIYKKDFWRTYTRPDFTDWSNGAKSLSIGKKWRHLPDKAAAGLHYLHRSSDTLEGHLGGLFVGFVDWFDDILRHPPQYPTIVDIARGHHYSGNTEATQRKFEQWIERGSVGEAPYFDIDQPFQWQKRRLVLRDPFIRYRDLLSGVPPESMARLRKESSKAQSMIKQMGDRCAFSSIALPL